MTKRGADYPRRKLDDYPTPLEVLDVLFENVELGPSVWDPACGKLKRVAKAAAKHGLGSSSTDITGGYDFLSVDTQHKYKSPEDIVTNPPYGDRRGSLALRFIEHALDLTKQFQKRVAMLLPIDFDSGKTRLHVFEHKAFAIKLVLLDRIKWFDGQSGSTNHAWYIWDWKNKRPPIIRYARINHER